MNPETVAALLDVGNTGIIIVSVIYLLREIGKRDELWRGFIRERDREMQGTLDQIVASNNAALDKLSEQIERMTTVVLLNVSDDDGQRMNLMEKFFDV